MMSTVWPYTAQLMCLLCFGIVNNRIHHLNEDHLRRYLIIETEMEPMMSCPRYLRASGSSDKQLDS